MSAQSLINIKMESLKFFVLLGVGAPSGIDVEIEMGDHLEDQINKNALSHLINPDKLGRVPNEKCWTMKTEFDQGKDYYSGEITQPQISKSVKKQSPKWG